MLPKNLGDLLCTLNFDQTEVNSKSVVKIVKPVDKLQTQRTKTGTMISHKNVRKIQRTETLMLPRFELTETGQQPTVPNGDIVNISEKAVTPHRSPQSSTTEFVSPHRGRMLMTQRELRMFIHKTNLHLVQCSPVQRLENWRQQHS